MRGEPEKPLTAFNAIGIGVATADGVDQVTLALAIVGLVSRRALRNIKIVDLASGDVVDKA